jgi:hypothetical protein
MRNRKHTLESIEKMKIAQRDRKPMSAAQKEKLRVINTGCVRVFTDDHKEKLSTAGKGRHITPEWRQKLSDANKGQGKGRTLSAETKAKLSAARRATLEKKSLQSKKPSPTI